MKKIDIILKSDPSKSFKCQKAAQSVDLNIEEKLKFQFSCEIDIPEKWNCGLILGNSGSGKTTVANHLFEKNDFYFKKNLDPEKTILDHFPENMLYDDCVKLLCGLGLTQVPCWLRPVKTLSNGQKFRAEVAYNLSLNPDKILIIDEWTSVVDRIVAKIMSHAISKYIQKSNLKIVLISCHNDIIEWVNPDWILNCNNQIFRRLVRKYERKEKLIFSIKRCYNNEIWKNFSKYHYLSQNIPGGYSFIYGLFYNEIPIGCIFYSRYMPQYQNFFHANRIVIHPDFCGFGLGGKLLNETAFLIKKEYKEITIFIKFSSFPMLKILKKSKDWKFWKKTLFLKNPPIPEMNNITRKKKIYSYSYKYLG